MLFGSLQDTDSQNPQNQFQNPQNLRWRAVMACQFFFIFLTLFTLFVTGGRMRTTKTCITERKILVNDNIEYLTFF